MNDNKLYVFFGCWVEYQLHPLYVYMKEQGYNCVEIIPDLCSDMRKELLKLNAGEYVFITSAHVFLDETYELYQNSSMNLSALEAMDILHPVKSVYYPHDLTTLIHKYDVPWLNSIFDIILFPVDGYAHLACQGKPVYNIGWIKKHGNIGRGTKLQAGHGLGDWTFYREVLDIMYDTFRSVWEQGVIVKAFELNERCEQTFWEKNNINYIHPSKSIFELIDSCEIMLTNGLTSVNIESALSGRFTINMLDDLAARSLLESFFKGLPNLKIMKVNEASELLREYYKGSFIPPQGEDLLKPFDFKRAVELITA